MNGTEQGTTKGANVLSVVERAALLLDAMQEAYHRGVKDGFQEYAMIRCEIERLMWLIPERHSVAGPVEAIIQALMTRREQEDVGRKD